MSESSYHLKDEYSLETDSEMTTSLGMKSAAVSTMKPMLGASLPREPVRMALAMVLTSSLASARLIWGHGGQKVHETNVASFTAKRAWSSGTGNGLEVLSSTCHTVLGSLRTGTPRKTDSEKSSSLGMKLAAVSTMKPMLGASQPREGTGNGLEVCSSKMVSQMLALEGRVLLGN